MTTTGTTLDRPAPADEPRPARDLLGWASFVARLLLAGVFGYAALTKLGDPQETVRAVRAYKLLPEGVAVPFGHALPWFELALAVLLLVGLAVRLSGVVAAVLMLMFVVGISSAWARGLKIDCGCFGGGGPNPDPQYVRELLRDVPLLLAALLVAWSPLSRHALDPTVPSAAELLGSSRKERQRTAAAQVRRDRALQRRKRHSFVAAAVLVLFSVVGMVSGAARSPDPAAPVPQGANAQGGIVVGRADAPVLLVVYEDPQCPVCERFERASHEALTQAVEAGRVRVEYRMRSFLGPESVRAVAALGAAADVGGFEALRAQLFVDQPPEQSGGYTVDDLLARGAAVGLTSDAFVSAVRDQRYAGWARRIDDLASKAGNVGTPEVLVDGRAVPIEVLLDRGAFSRFLDGLR